jgi:hypothetical protein
VIITGTTGGTLPVGHGEIAAFDMQTPAGIPPGTSFNHSIIQQGLSAEVSCEEDHSSLITQTTCQKINVTNAGANSDSDYVIEQNFTLYFTPPKPLDFSYADLSILMHAANGRRCNMWKKTMVTSASASIACFLCQPDPQFKEYVLYVMPFNSYAKPYAGSGNQPFPKLQCNIKPHITVNNVTYSSATGLFNSSLLSTNPHSFLVPNETVQSLELVLDASATPWVSAPMTMSNRAFLHSSLQLT